jgi:hypothetical protein
MLCTPHQILYSGDQIKKNELDGACSTYGGRRGEYRFWWGDLRGRDHLVDST